MVHFLQVGKFKKMVDLFKKKLKRFFKNSKSKINLIGAGRTDKGVHAIGQYANFKINKPVKDIRKFLGSVNYFLNKHLISIIKITKKKLDFNSRFNAKERIYEYVIINRSSNLSLDKNRAWHIKKIRFNTAEKGAKILEGKHNFSTYRAASCSSRSPIKRLIYKD